MEFLGGSEPPGEGVRGNENAERDCGGNSNHGNLSDEVPVV